MKRQLYRGGGIMGLSREGIGGGDYKGYDMGSRVGYGIIKKVFSGAKKAVKKVTGAVKDIASSDLGKAALAGAAVYGLGGGFGPKGFGIGNLPGAGFFTNAVMPGSGESLTGTSAFSKLFSNAGKIGKLAGLAGVTGFLTSNLGMSEEQAGTEFKRDPSKYLELYYRNLNPPTADEDPEVYEQEVRNFVSTNTSEYAEGGRIGYDSGTPDPKIPEQFLEDLKRRKLNEMLDQYRRFQEDYERRKDMAPTQEAAMGGRIGYDIGGNAMTASYGYDDAMSETYNNFLDMKKNKQIPIDMDFDEFLRDVVPEMSKMQTEGRGLAAMGGRMNYALGDSASQNAMQAAGIEGLPMRQNPKGVKELDLRDNGGFIPPVGIKEKEDDIPAMLSNNEFVFTADAVRGMGDGDVELGAQRMYDQMKTLEEGGRV